MSALKPKENLLSNVTEFGSTYAPWQQRVLVEKQELCEKIKKLGAFLVTEDFEAADPDERERLTRQLDAMVTYRNILSERIAVWEPKQAIPENVLAK